MPRVAKCASGRPLPPDVLEEAVGVISSGGLVVYPACTLYGLGAGIRSVTGLEKVNTVKGRPEGMPVSVMATGPQVMELCSVPKAARRFIDSGESRLTMVMPASSGIPVQLAGKGTIGVRLPCSELTRSLVEAAGPITATSANLHGGAAPEDIGTAVTQLGLRASLYIDAGRQSGTPSTVVDFTSGEPRIIREGALPSREVLG